MIHSAQVPKFAANNIIDLNLTCPTLPKFPRSRINAKLRDNAEIIDLDLIEPKSPTQSFEATIKVEDRAIKKEDEEEPF